MKNFLIIAITFAILIIGFFWQEVKSTLGDLLPTLLLSVLIGGFYWTLSDYVVKKKVGTWVFWVTTILLGVFGYFIFLG